MPAKNAINGVFVESLEEMSTNVNHRRPSTRPTNPPAAQTEFSATQFKEPDYRDGTFAIEPQEAAFANDFDFKSSATSSTQNTGKESLLLECPLGDVSGKDENYIKSIKEFYMLRVRPDIKVDRHVDIKWTPAVEDKVQAVLVVGMQNEMRSKAATSVRKALKDLKGQVQAAGGKSTKRTIFRRWIFCRG